MTKGIYFRSGSVLAVAMMLAGASPVFAQKAAPPAEDTSIGEVVITGSFIRGTPEEAAIPVEGINLDEIREQGSPSNMDLIKNLSEIGSVAGEANRTNAFAIGAQSVNLRSLSSSRTVVVFNGRRFPEAYSFSVGRFNNIAQIPNAAIGRVEVLKDGGATTYGADAVGGVVNYLTRKPFDGLEAQATYRLIDGSNGDYNLALTGGRKFDKGNFLISLGFDKRSELDAKERDWALQPYYVNSTGWQSQARADGSPGSYIFQTGLTNTTSITPTAAGANTYTGDRQIGSAGVVRDMNCNVLGGFSGYNTTGSPVCYNQTGRISNLVEEISTFQAYAEANYEFSEKFKLHGEFLYYGFEAPHVPIDNGGYFVQSYPLANPLGGAPQAGPGGSAFFADGRNPAVAQYLSSFTNLNGTTAFTAAQIASITTGGRVVLQSGLWRPFFASGNGLGQEADMQKNFTDQYRFTLEAKGSLGKFLNGDWDYSVAGTANPLTYHITSTDILTNRMQAALSGYGGATCNQTTGQGPGTVFTSGGVTSTCQWFNPFSTAMPKDQFTGTVNPNAVTAGTYTGYVAGQGLQNSQDLVRWMTVPLDYERRSNFIILDGLLRSSFDWHPLWSKDNIDVAVGVQYRELHEIGMLPDLANKAVNPCATPLVTSCTSQGSPLMYNRGLYLIGFNNSTDRTYPIASGFAEAKLPITESFYVQAATRYEKFFSDVGAIDNDVMVNQFSARWQATPWLALRGTAGQTFSNVNPPANIPPSTTLGNAATAFGGTGVINLATLNYPNLAVAPENGLNYNLGALFNLGDFSASLDYYDIKIKGQVRALSSTDVLNALAVLGQAVSLNGARLINCASPLLSDNQALLGNAPFVTLGSACTQGTSTYQNSLSGATVRFFGAQGQQTLLVNGSDLHTTGIDAGLQYHRGDVFGGDLKLNFDVSYILKYDQTDFVFAGVTITPGYDGLGRWNTSVGGQRVAQYRGSIGGNYNIGRHGFNWSTRMVSATINEDVATYFTASGVQNPNIGNASGVVTSNTSATACSTLLIPTPATAGTGQYGTLPASAGVVGYDACQNRANLLGQRIPATFSSDFTYTLRLPTNVTMTLTVQNVFDTDPEFSRDQLNYDAYTGSPLGRTFRFGIRKTW